MTTGPNITMHHVVIMITFPSSLHASLITTIFYFLFIYIQIWNLGMSPVPWWLATSLDILTHYWLVHDIITLAKYAIWQSYRIILNMTFLRIFCRHLRILQVSQNPKKWYWQRGELSVHHIASFSNLNIHLCIKVGKTPFYIRLLIWPYRVI